MGSVVLEMSMSLDGFIAGPHVDVERPMGEGGERLHDWMFAGKTERETDAFQREKFKAAGAVVTGRRTYDLGEGPWGDDPPFHLPVFVLTHGARDKITKRGGTTYAFVTNGIESGLRQARAVAGGKDVVVLGGASIAQQYLGAGLLDELRIHLVPILLGAGTRLFDQSSVRPIELDKTGVVDTPGVTHLTFCLGKGP